MGGNVPATIDFQETFGVFSGYVNGEKYIGYMGMGFSLLGLSGNVIVEKNGVYIHVYIYILHIQHVYIYIYHMYSWGIETVMR